MINYLFCLDENYNKQFLITLYSLDLKSTKLFNVFVVHNSPDSLEQLIEKNNIKFNKLNSLKIFKFKNVNYSFPNLKNNHISEATYYRFFIEDYISNDIGTLVYLDCDILCLNNPEKYLEENLNKLINSEYIIGASTEYTYTINTKELFDRLQLSSNSYFNAGVLLIDYKKWIENTIKVKLLSQMKNIYDKVNFWDQDILNSLFDGRYLLISNYLNYTSCFNPNHADLRSVIFLHFSGSKKPWTIEGVISGKYSTYHNYYSILFKDKYFIITNYKKGTLKLYLKALLSLRIFNLNFPIQFTKQIFKTLLK